MQLFKFSSVFFAALASANLIPHQPLPANYDGQFSPVGLTACGLQCYNENVAAAVGCNPLDMMALCG